MLAARVSRRGLGGAEHAPFRLGRGRLVVAALGEDHTGAIAQPRAQGLQHGRLAGGMNPRTAVALDAQPRGVGPDQRHGLDSRGIQRRQAAVVLKQDEGFLGGAARDGLMTVGTQLAPRGWEAVEMTGADHQAHDPPGRLVDLDFRDQSVLHGLQQFGPEIVRRAGHLQIEAGIDRRRRGMDRPPVGNRDAVIPPFLF